MSSITKEEIKRIVQEQDVRFIRLQFTDILGMMKNVTITASQLAKALDNKCMFDGSSIEGFVRIEESDMYLVPDIDTFLIFPWEHEKGKIARMICDVYTSDGQPFGGDPRYTLQKVLKEAQQLGLTFDVGPECEFFLFQNDKDGRATTITNDDGGYFDLGAYDLGEDARRDICLALEEMNYEIEASHHECAIGQHEIDFRYSAALQAADNIMTFKLAVKKISSKHGLHATFMPKPIYGIAGSGMHVNISARNSEDENVFYDPQDSLGLSKLAYSFIAGLLEHAKGMSAITNPLVNSYKRLVPGFEAPCYIAWSAKNRSPLIRIPSARGKGTRIELRNPDPSANPYLALAVIIAAGLDGIKRGLTPPPSCEANIYDLTDDQREEMGIENVPSNLKNAITALKKDPLVKEALGDHITHKYLLNKEQEWQAYRERVYQWEIDNYLKY